MFDSLRTLEDVQRLIDNGFRESETLDYKEADVVLGDGHHKDIVKDVSAFANSQGGLIIYGVACGDKSDKTRPTHLAPIAPRNIEIIQQVIAQNIARPIRGIRYQTIPESGTPQLLLLDVPASPDAPHQNLKDHRYYRRNGTVSQSMPHDLVALYFGRRLGPRLTMSYELTRISPATSSKWSAFYELQVQALNDGARVARHLLLQLWVPVADWFQFGGAEPHTVLTISASGDGVRTISLANDRSVLHPTLAVTFSLKFACRRDIIAKSTPFITLLAYAEDMEPVKHQLAFRYDAAEKLEVVLSDYSRKSI